MAAMRRTLAVLFVLGAIGTGAELLLLDHTEDAWQKVPLVLVGAGCAAVVWLMLLPSAAAVRLVQLVMLLFIASGFIGIGLHYQANTEFALELDPGASGLTLFQEAITGALPALAPGSMMLLGAIGLTCTYRHPAVTHLED